MLSRFKEWVRTLRQDVLALYIAARDRRTPVAAKLVAAAVAAYALSPVDLIPDFIPVLGLLDDLILVPVGIWFSVALIPPPLMREFRATATRHPARPRSMPGAIAIISIWLVSAVLLGLWLWCMWAGEATT